jgi:hypothetical protein
MRAEAHPTGRNVYRHISRLEHNFSRATLQIHTPNSHNTDTKQAKKNQPRLAGPHNVTKAYGGHGGKAGQHGALHSSILPSLQLLRTQDTEFLNSVTETMRLTLYSAFIIGRTTSKLK